MTYKIIVRTYGRKWLTIAEGLTLRDAQKKLLELFNGSFATYYTNWGRARKRKPEHTMSYKDGTRSYEHNGSQYFIEYEE